MRIIMLTIMMAITPLPSGAQEDNEANEFYKCYGLIPITKNDRRFSEFLSHLRRYGMVLENMMRTGVIISAVDDELYTSQTKVLDWIRRKMGPRYQGLYRNCIRMQQ